MIEQAKQTDETIFEEVQPYMLAIFPRLTFNYLSLTLSVLLLWFIGVGLLRNIVPQSIATSIVFAVSLVLFFYGWRFLENRNHATALFALYTRYSRQRRDLKTQIANDADEETLLNTLHLLEESAQAFIEAAKENGVEPVAVEE